MEVAKLIPQYSELLIYITEKDSKRFYIYNTKTQALSLNTVNTPTNFPHNFQAIQVGLVETKVYICGGGDFNHLPDTMFQMNRIVKTADGAYAFEQKQRMKYPRHGHSCCSVGENLIVVTGSRKDIDKAQFRTELYNTNTDKWIELAQMNQARHYHSSCSFQCKWIYVFCGISNQTKKYLNTIERLEIIPGDI